MSSQRVIQDSDDDESGDNYSDVATSIDPLQDPSLQLYTPSASEDHPRTAEHDKADERMLASISETNHFPRVDFDKYLRTESSILPGDYEDERWASTADAAPTGEASQTNREHNGQHRDESFVYRTNAADHTVPDTLPLPSTADVGRFEPQQSEHEEAAYDHEHASKRRKISLTQNTLQEQPSDDKSELDVSYNYFASFDPHGGPSQAVTEPHVSADLPRQPEKTYGQEADQERCETPPPTVPFSEDVLYDQLTVAKNELPPATINESGIETHDQGAGTDPVINLEYEAPESKKKRGRPKKQSPADKAEDQTDSTSGNKTDQVDELSRKKPGRPKKNDQTDRDSSPDELAMDEIVKHQTDDVRGRKATSKPDKPAKKKVRRSKTTSDLPDTTSSEMVDRDVLWIDDTPVVDLEKDTDAKTMKENETAVVPPSEEEISRKPNNDESSATNNNRPEPKKRGRKKKSTTEGPPATYAESSTALQDISNTTYPSTNNQETFPVEKAEDAEPNTTIETEPPQENLETATSLAETPANQEDTTPARANEESPAPITKQTPARHSPIPNMSKVPFRVGLSRRARIAPLLKVVRK